MPKPELVLSNSTTFFSGNLENLFKKAKGNGFKYLEIVPYRWTKPEQIFAWEKKYQIQVVGLHLPEWWDESLLRAIRNQANPLEKVFAIIWHIYLGSIATNPALRIASRLKEQKREFYVLTHINLVIDNPERFAQIQNNFPNVIENVPFYHKYQTLAWDPVEIRQTHPSSGLAFDVGHFSMTPNYSKLLHIYPILKPEIIHISYGKFPPHKLPNQKQQEELKAMLQLHQPCYIVLETNPLVSVKKGKEVLERIIGYSEKP